MTELVLLIERFGLPTIAAGVLLYLVIKGELFFRYPRR